MTTEANSATQRLEELQAAVAEAEGRLYAIERERRRVAAELARATAPLTAYFEEIGAGEREPDPALEEKLAADVRDARATATMRISRSATDPAKITGADWVDERIEAKFAGAQRALEERREELTAFLNYNRELAAEWVAEGIEVREECEARWRELDSALRRWQSVAVRWGPFLEASGIDRSEMPAHPLAGIDRDPGRGFPLPAPASLIPDEEPLA